MSGFPIQYTYKAAEAFVFCSNSSDSWWLSEDDFSCAPDVWNFCYCPRLLGEPDIAGIGVLVAFITSAGITLIATGLCLLLSRSSEKTTINFLDKFCRRHLCENFQSLVGDENAELWLGCLFDLVMSFSDQQLVTGIAVLVAGIKKLADGNITIYHFSLVTDLAWFSSNTHLLSLLTIRDFSESVKPSKSPTLSHTQVRINFPGPRILRAFLMVLLAALLLYCSYVTGYEDWYESFRCPARCTLAGSKGGKPLDWTIMNFTLILYAYPIAMIQLFPWSRRFWIENLRHKLIDDKGLLPPEPPSPISLPHNHAKPPTNLTKATAATPSTPGATPPGPLTVIWKAWWSVFLLIWYTMSSEVLTFVVQIVWFSLGVKWTLEDRVNGHSAMEQEEIDAENEWGFAQLVPILLLLLPFLQLVQSYSAQKEKLRKKRAKTQTQDQNLPMALLTPLTTP